LGSRLTPQQPTPPQQPSVALEVINPNVMSTPLQPNWANQLDIDAIIAKMMSTEKSHAIAILLRDGQPLRSCQRNDLVRFVVDKVTSSTKSPGRKNLEIIAEKLVGKYPQLRDEWDGTVMGKGFMSLRNQLECRVEYLKRFGKIPLKKPREDDLA